MSRICRSSPAARVSSPSSISSCRLKRHSFSSPSILFFHRSFPPITEDSTSNRSHRHGARSVPAISAVLSRSAARGSVSDCSSTGGSGSTPSGSTSDGGGAQLASGLRADSGSGTCESEVYSAKRRAEKSSDLHASSASNARPAGSGRVVP